MIFFHRLSRNSAGKAVPDDHAAASDSFDRLISHFRAVWRWRERWTSFECVAPSSPRYQVASTSDPLLFDVENKFFLFRDFPGFSFLLSRILSSAKSESLVVFLPLIRACRSVQGNGVWLRITLRWKLVHDLQLIPVWRPKVWFIFAERLSSGVVAVCLSSISH